MKTNNEAETPLTVEIIKYKVFDNFLYNLAISNKKNQKCQSKLEVSMMPAISQCFYCLLSHNAFIAC